MQFFQLLFVLLFSIPRPDAFLVQNPPRLVQRAAPLASMATKRRALSHKLLSSRRRSPVSACNELLVCIARPRRSCSIPTLFIVWLVSRLRGSRVIIDWHNFGYTVLSLSLQGRYGWLLSIAYRYEQAMASMADGHLCVTNAMSLWLKKNWGIR